MLQFERICECLFDRTVSLYDVVFDHELACAFVVGLSEHVRWLLRASSQMDSLRARVILKDDAPASRLIVTAAKPEQRGTNLTSVNEPHSDLVSHVCGGDNHSEIV